MRDSLGTSGPVLMRKATSAARLSNLLARCIAAVGLVACTSDVISEYSVGVTVYGRVSTTTGVSVSGAAVRVGFTPDPGCATVATGSGVSTDPAGYYGTELNNVGGPFHGCVKVVAIPPASAPLLPDSVVRDSVPFTATRDSVRVDIVLRPSA